MRYDVIVLGHNIAALAAAAFLSRHGRHVALFSMGQPLDGKAHNIRMVDANRKHYRFIMPTDTFGGLGEGALTARYLNSIGMDTQWSVVPNTHAQIVHLDGRTWRRDHTAAGFRIYLVRHYPKYKKAIDRFFSDLSKHYEDYLKQRTLRLFARPHTLNTLTAQFGSQSLETALQGYFKDGDLRQEFTYLQPVAGLSLKDIHAVDYFKYWFQVMYKQAYFLSETYESLWQRLTQDAPYDCFAAPLKRIEFDQQRIVSIETNDGQVHSSQHVVVGMAPELFVQTFVTHEKGFVSERIAPPFRARPVVTLKGTAMVGLKGSIERFGIVTTQTYFETHQDGDAQLLMVFDQSQLDAGAAPPNYGAIQVDYLCRTALDEVRFKALLEAKLPGITAAITKIKFGPLEPYRGGHHAYYDTQKSLKRLDAMDRFAHLRVFENAWFVGPFSAPETGLLGQLMLGVELGDVLRSVLDMLKIKGRRVTVEMLIAIFTDSLDGAQTKTWNHDIAWRIGTHVCTWSFRQGMLTLYHGSTKHPDVKLACGLETFIHLVTGTLTPQQALDQQVLSQTGNQAFAAMFLATTPQGVDDFNQPTRRLGRLSLLGSASLFVLMLVWGHYGYFFLFPGILAVLLAGKAGVHRFVLKNMPWLDVFLLVALGGTVALKQVGMTAAAWPALALAFWLFLGHFWPKIGVWPYWAVDYPFAQTRWFIKTTGGLNFLYAVLLMPLVVSLFYAADMNAFLGIYALLLGAFVTRNYPALYAKSQIKRRT